MAWRSAATFSMSTSADVATCELAVLLETCTPSSRVASRGCTSTRGLPPALLSAGARVLVRFALMIFTLEASIGCGWINYRQSRRQTLTGNRVSLKKSVTQLQFVLAHHLGVEHFAVVAHDPYGAAQAAVIQCLAFAADAEASALGLQDHAGVPLDQPTLAHVICGDHHAPA